MSLNKAMRNVKGTTCGAQRKDRAQIWKNALKNFGCIEQFKVHSGLYTVYSFSLYMFQHKDFAESKKNIKLQAKVILPMLAEDKNTSRNN